MEGLLIFVTNTFCVYTSFNFEYQSLYSCFHTAIIFILPPNNETSAYKAYLFGTSNKIIFGYIKCNGKQWGFVGKSVGESANMCRPKGWSK